MRLESAVAAVSVLNYGAITRSWEVHAQGKPLSVVLGYKDLHQYLADPFYLGAIVGRVANRTANGRFRLNGKTCQLTQNEGRHHLHGGIKGLGRRLWQMERDGARRLRLRYLSPDGEEGYPGTVRFTVDMALSGSRLTYDMRAVPDRPTPINLAQHNYYNLAGGQGDIFDHSIRIQAAQYTPTDGEGIPTGQVCDVEGTPLDLRKTVALHRVDPERKGIDSNLLFDPGRDRKKPVAELRAPNGLRLRMWSDQPGLQLYTGAGLKRPAFRAFTGMCLEPQYPPDCLNNPGFCAIIATPEAPYRQVLTVDINGDDAG